MAEEAVSRGLPAEGSVMDSVGGIDLDGKCIGNHDTWIGSVPKESGRTGSAPTIRPKSRMPAATVGRILCGMIAPRHLAAAAILLAAVSTGCSHETARAKHLLLISVDTLNADHLGCYGGKNRPSPAIDQLASEGARFERAYVPRGMTLASMATYFTSKYPSEHGVIDNIHKLSRDEYTLAERLDDAGFRRLAYNASEILNSDRGTRIDQGFKQNVFFTKVGEDRALTRDVVSYLKSSFGKNPKREFVWVHLVSPHKPYEPPRESIAKFDPGYSGKLDTNGKELEAIVEGVYLKKEPLDAKDKKHFDAIYDGEVVTVDTCVSEMMAALEASGAADDTLVVFVADHGEELYLHNLYPYHANCPYRCVTRVPWIFRQKGAIAPKVVPDVVESVDFLPTVLAWLGLSDKIPGDTEANKPRGRDASALLTGATLPEKLAFGRIDECADRPENTGVGTVRDAHWSLVVNTDGWCPDFPPEGGSYPIPSLALYDLDKDPDELLDVAKQHPEVVTRLSEALAGWIGPLKTHNADLIDKAKSPEEIEMLKKLGYTGGAVSSEPQRVRCNPR